MIRELTSAVLTPYKTRENSTALVSRAAVQPALYTRGLSRALLGIQVAANRIQCIIQELFRVSLNIVYR